ncbi:MAG: 50S ribosomal protein L25, partial [Acidimicrobiia bacterium]
LEVLFSRPGGARALVNLVVEGGTELVMPRQIQRNAVRRNLVHLDLLRVSRDTAVSVELPVHLIGEPAGVATGGLLEQQLFTLAVEGRPGDLPPALEVDVSALDIGDQIRVSDMVLPSGVVTSAPGDDLVASVVPPHAPEVTEVAEAAAEEAPAATEG